MSERDRSQPGPEETSRYPASFLRALDETIRALGWTLRSRGPDTIDVTDTAGGDSTVGLENLYRRACQTTADQWPQLIRSFLTSVHPPQHPELTAASDLAAAADRLLVRIRQPGGGTTEELVWSEPLFGTDLAVCLVIDHPESMRFVTRDMIAEAGRPGDEWLEKAIANLRAITPDDYLSPLDEDFGLLLGNRNDAYDAARALLIDDLVTEAPHGCFVALPTRDCLLVVPVTAPGIASLHVLKGLADNFYRTKPYAITAEVFWVRENYWRPFGIEMKNRTLNLTPPPEFEEVLRDVMPDGDDDETDD